MTAGDAAERLQKIDKQRLLDVVRDELRRELEAVTSAQRATAQGATHEESKPENDKDTRATESSYLARGQARRVEELSEDLTRLGAVQPRAFEPGQPIVVGALVALEDLEAEPPHVEFLFVLPAAGGVSVQLDGVTFKIVTPRSPLGKAFIGRSEGDDVEVAVPRGRREYSIVSVA